MLNASPLAREFDLPKMPLKGAWELVFHSAETEPTKPGPSVWHLVSRSMGCAYYVRAKYD